MTIKKFKKPIGYGHFEYVYIDMDTFEEVPNPLKALMDKYKGDE